MAAFAYAKQWQGAANHLAFSQAYENSLKLMKFFLGPNSDSVRGNMGPLVAKKSGGFQTELQRSLEMETLTSDETRTRMWPRYFLSSASLNPGPQACPFRMNENLCKTSPLQHEHDSPKFTHCGRVNLELLSFGCCPPWTSMKTFTWRDVTCGL